jgi:hypothetical protein
MIEFDEEEWQINIQGSNQIQNYFIPIVLLIGGIKAFASIGFSPITLGELRTNPTLYSESTQLPIFGPQSFSLIGYGSAALVLGGFLLFSTLSNLGAGTIKFEKTSQQIILAFKNYIGENQKLFFSYNFQELQCIRIIYVESPYRKQSIFLALKGGRQIPIWSSDQPAKFSDAELFVTNLGLEMGFSTEIIQRKT